LVDVSSAPSALEQGLGRLVDAGIVDADDLAAALGLQAHHIGRPLRKLTLAGVLEREPSGDLRVTPAGRTWLSIEATPVAELLSLPERSAAPGLLAPQIAVDEDPDLERVPRAEDRAAPDVGGGQVPLAHSPEGWTRPLIVASIREMLGGVRKAMRRVRIAMPAFRLGWPRVQLTVEAHELSTSTVRRIVALTASAVVIMTGVRLAVPAGPSTKNALPVGVDAVHDDAQPLAIEPVATPRPAATSTLSERWVIVNHTNGVGLVLRPAPATSARILTLADGARLRVTGEPVQQDGRAWLPVASQSGKIGWVASDFVAPEP
jgi:hypothetical protein